MDTAVTLPFADGEYRFWLPLPQVFELERNTGDASILVLEERMRAAIGVSDKGEFVFVGGGAAMIKDVRETIRCALVGGDSCMVDGAEAEVGPIRAKVLVDTYVYPARPLAEGIVLAWRILHAAINGVKLDDVKKKGSSPKAGKAEPKKAKSASPSLKDS